MPAKTQQVKAAHTLGRGGLVLKSASLVFSALCGAKPGWVFHNDRGRLGFSRVMLGHDWKYRIPPAGHSHPCGWGRRGPGYAALDAGTVGAACCPAGGVFSGLSWPGLHARSGGRESSLFFLFSQVGQDSQRPRAGQKAQAFSLTTIRHIKSKKSNYLLRSSQVSNDNI